MQKTLRRQFFSQRYGTTSSQPVLIIIDRTGWLRRITKVETAGQLQFALRSLADVTPKIEVGLPTPDFVVPEMNGVSRRPVDLQGKIYLLMTFFPKCFTGSCIKKLS